MFRPLLCGFGFALLLAFTVPAWADVTGLVRGNVTVENGPRANVPVTIHDERSQLQTRTDPEGSFTFARIPFGHYVVTAHLAGYPDATATVDVSTDSVTSV